MRILKDKNNIIIKEISDFEFTADLRMWTMLQIL